MSMTNSIISKRSLDDMHTDDDNDDDDDGIRRIYAVAETPPRAKKKTRQPLVESVQSEENANYIPDVLTRLANLASTNDNNDGHDLSDNDSACSKTGDGDASIWDDDDDDDKDEEVDDDDDGIGKEEDDGDEEDMTLEPMSKEEKSFYNKYILKYRDTSSIVRTISEPICIAVAKSMIKHNEFENPLSTFKLRKIEIGRKGKGKGKGKRCIYFIMSREGKRILKVGMTGDYEIRFGKYIAKGYLPEQFVIVLDFDNISLEAYNELKGMYDELANGLLDCNQLEPFQKFWWKALFPDHRCELGGRTNIMCQIIESGFQKILNLNCPMEFAMFNQQVEDQAFANSQAEALKIMNVIPNIRSMMQQCPNKFFVHAKASWKPGANHLSVTIMVTQCILGPMFKDRWSNTLPVPAERNARGTKEIFSKDFSSRKRRQGRESARKTIRQLLASKFGIIYLDTNDVIFGDDPNSKYASVYAFLNEEFPDLEQKLVLRYGELIVFVNSKGGKHAIIVHGPLCLGGTSINCEPVYRVQRSLSAATLCNVQRLVQGIACLCKHDEFANPIHAMMAFQLKSSGLHGGLRQAAAFFKYFVRLGPTSTTVNPLVQNAIPKLGVDTPSPMSLRSRKRPVPVSKRSEDDPIVLRGRRLLSNSTDDTLEQSYLYMTNILFKQSKGNTDNRLVLSRYSELLKRHVVPGSSLDQKLKDLRKVHGHNSGNTEAFGITKPELQINNVSFGALVELHKPDQSGNLGGGPFWVQPGRAKRLLKAMSSYTQQEDFPGKHTTIFDDLVFGGLENRLKECRVLGEAVTKHTRATKTPEYGLSKCQVKGICPSTGNVYVLVNLIIKNSSKFSHRK